MSNLHHGTSSWSSKDWVGPLYPEGTPPGDFLTVYSEHFPAVEADVTYYRLPDERLVDGWRRKTPEGFQLCAKFPRSIVHGGEGKAPDPDRVLVPDAVLPDTERFLEVMSRLGSRLGPLVLQFPYFNQRAFKELGPFLERLTRYLDLLPGGLRYGVEVRNRQWLQPDLLDVLRQRNVALVLVDLAYMPHPAGLQDLDLVTADFSYARLIGDRKKVDEATRTFDRIVVDQSSRLERWVPLLQSLGNQVVDLYVFANNHYAGHGPATIRDLVARLEKEQQGDE